MNRFVLKILAVVVLLICISLGCSDISTVVPPGSTFVIKSVVPAQAPYGADITISGSGFGDSLEDQEVYFNSTLASIETLSDTTIQTRVPVEATDGPVMVIVQGDTLTGPIFSVDSTKSLFLTIESIHPTAGRTGEKVQIIGTGFNSNPKENRVFFNEAMAPISSASDTLLTAIVPPKAETGSVSVVARQDTSVGPAFTVIKPMISGISPLSGPVGTDVTITGSGFIAKTSENTVTFGGVEASLKKSSERELIATVPKGAKTGPVSVKVGEDTAVGPEFTIMRLMIAGISPLSGPVGTDVTITGSGFSSTISENTVTFGGSKASIKSASKTELVATVPESAETGPVIVTVAQLSAQGPEFAVEIVQEPKTLLVVVETTGEKIDENGYTLLVSGKEDRAVKPNDEHLYENILTEALQVEIAGIAEHCSLKGENPRKIVMDSDKKTTFSISCINLNEPPIAFFTSECTNLGCTFDGSGSKDSDGSVETYSWEFGDGQTNTGPSVTHTYDEPGTYSVQLTVTDDDEATAKITNDVRLTIPQITGISPTSGPVGTDVTITGSGFSSTISENSVTFNGMEASIETVSETEILAIVPEMTTTGPVEVTVNGYTVTGPTFTIDQPRTLQVTVATVGTAQDDGYTLSVSDQPDTDIMPNDEVEYFGLFADEVQVSLSDVASNCRVAEENPQNVSLEAGMTSDVEFNVDCTLDLRGKIVYKSDRDNFGELYLQNPNSNLPPMRLTQTADYYEGEPAISPDGLKIVFVDTKAGRSIYAMDSDGSDLQQLTNDGWNTAPSWSPDGSQIVFARASNSDAAADLYVMDSNGNNLKNITNTGTARESNPDWSPDGSLIVYENYINPDSEIFTIQLDGSNKKKITDNDVFDFEPEWSPSGDRIAFVHDGPDTGKNIHIMKSNGSGEPQKLTYYKGTEASPSWSPDGSKIVYSKYIEGYYQISIYSVAYNDILNTYYTPYTDLDPHWNYK